MSVGGAPEPYAVDAFALTGDLLDAIVGVYADAASPPATDADRRRGLFVRHTLEPGWQAVAVGRPPVGFAYGFHCAPGQWWHDTLRRGMRAELGLRATRSWLSDAFCLAELHVHPAAQRQGVGRMLVERLLDGRPERAVVLSTPDAAEARKFYARLGFTELLSGFAFPGTPSPYTVLGRRAPGDTGGRSLRRRGR